MTDFDVIAAVFVIAGFFAVLAGLVVAANLVIVYERDQWRKRRALREDRQVAELDAIYELEWTQS